MISQPYPAGVQPPGSLYFCGGPGGYDLEGQERERALVQKFRLADKDGNGVIDREELAALLSAFEDGAVEPEEQW